MLLVLAGADVCWPLHEQYGLLIERIPARIASTAQPTVDDLKARTTERRR
jgi:hypothetical protein